MKQPHDCRKVLLEYGGQVLAIEIERNFDNQVQGLVKALQGRFVVFILGDEYISRLRTVRWEV